MASQASPSAINPPVALQDQTIQNDFAFPTRPQMQWRSDLNLDLAMDVPVGFPRSPTGEVLITNQSLELRKLAGPLRQSHIGPLACQRRVAPYGNQLPGQMS